MDADVRAITVTGRETRNGDPMWTLQMAGGNRVHIFDNMLERRPWENSGYPSWIQAMECGQTDRWMNAPIRVAVAKRGDYFEVASVQLRAPDAKLDNTAEPVGVWQLYGPHWWSTLTSLTTEDTIVFDTETTGVDPELDVAVSIAEQSCAAPNGADVEYHTLIASRFPEKLVRRNAEMQCAYDVHGFHQHNLVGQPTFPLILRTLWEIMRGKNWVCWKADFDVTLLDSLCIWHRLPLIPRNRVVCAM